MSKKAKSLDAGQAVFDFDRAIDRFVAAKEDALQACAAPGPRAEIESEEEICYAIARALKRALAGTGWSREELADQINEMFGRSDGDEAVRKPLSIHMLNNYLSKPFDYPIPAYYLAAIVALTGSLEAIQVLAEPVGAQILGESERREVQLGKIEAALTDLQRLKRQIKGAGASY